MPQDWRILVLPFKLLLAVILYQPSVLALPQGGVVTQGQAVIQQESATKLNINQSSDRAVINWNSFSIGAPEWVNFQQPSSTSATLNRVTGNTPSSIAGKLTANGQIFLINPNGIAFLPTAQVDVAGLVASTLNIKDSDFMQGILRFEQMPGKPPASVVNEGLITVKEAGFAALVAPAVHNSGVISARLGKVVLASGTTVSLDFYGDGLLSVTVDPQLAGQITDIYGNKLSSLINNQGIITAPGGIVTLSAQAAGQIVDRVINTGGIIEAKYAENRNGVIVLSGGSKGTIAVNGVLDVSGEKGGKIQITGENVGLFGSAKVDASGDKSGGLVFIGGDYLGGQADKQRIDPSLNAQNTYVSSGSVINADAKVTGNGGEVIVWADNFTRFDGTITARGDNGGFVETSGKNILEIGDTAQVDTTGRIGETGTWLLDPLDLTISGTGTNNNVTGVSPFQPTGTGSILRDTTINTALGTNNVVVKTVGTTGTARGDITFANNANVNWATNKTFTVQAAGQIVMTPGSKVESTNTGTFNAIIFQANTAGTTTGNFNGIELQNNTQLSTKGGSIQLTGVGGTSLGNTGILISGSNTSITTAGAGTITITGTGKGTSGNNAGIVQELGAQVSTVNGAISYTGTGSNATNNNYGIYLDGTNTSVTTTGTGTITLTGKGQGTGTNNYGILQKDSAKVTTANGIITYKGTGASTADGIRIESGNNIIGGNSNKSVVLTSLNNGITLNDVKIQTKENIIITSPGNVIQNNNGGLFATTAGKGLQLNGAGNYTLTNPNNDIATLAAKNTGNISYRDANGFVVGTVGTVNGISIGTKNITLSAEGAVTQTQAIIANGLELTGTNATYTLTNTGNNVTTLAANTNNNLSFTDSNALIIGTVGATNGINAPGKNVTLKVNAGTVTQTQAIIAGGLELKGNATYTLTNVNNDVTTLAANVDNPLSFTDKNTLIIGTVNTTNGITTINDLVTLQTGGLLTINKAIAVGTEKVSINSVDGVIQGTAGVITGTGLRLLGTGTFNLNNTSNNIALLAADVNGSLTYVDSNVMAIDTVLGTTGVKTKNNPINISTVNGNLTVVNTAAVNDVDAGSSTVNLTAGGNNIFTNNANAKITGTGGVTITANSMTLNGGSVINSGTNITTLQPNTAGRLINLGGADIAATTLGLTSAELNTVTAGTLRVGKNDSGNITVSTAIAPSGTNTLSLITGGAVSQNAGATITETNLAIKSGSAITLNQSNQITNFAANATTGNVTLNDLGGLNIDTVDGVNGINAPNFNLTTTGNITQSAGANILTSGITTLNAGTNTITLTNSGNSFTNLNVLNASNASLTNSVGFNIQGINATGNVSLNAGGAVTQTGQILANTLDLQGAGSYTLNDSANNITTLTGNTTGAISYTDANDFTVGNLTTNNSNITLNAPNINTISFAGNVNTGSGNLTVTSGTINQTAGGITVNGTANFTSTKANTGNVTVNNNTATQLGGSIIGGDFTLTSTGNVTQSGSLKVAGTTTITAPNGLSGLTDPNNVLPNAFSPTTGDLIITGVGTVNLPANTITGNLTVTSLASGTGFAGTFGGSAITLDKANNFGGTVSFNTQTAGLVSLSGTPKIIQSGVQTVGQTSTFNAIGGTIDLNLNNQLTGAITLNTGATGGNINLINNQPTVIAGATTGANLAITSNGNLTQTGAVNVSGGTTTLNAGGNDITFNNAGNDFNTLLLTAKNATITDSNALVLGTSNLTNNLSITTTGDLTQTGAVTAGGTTTINTNGNDVTLNNPGNDFNTLLLTAKNATITDSNALILGASNLTNNLSITTTGDLTQTGAVTAGGTTTINTNGNDVTLNNAGNDFNSLLLTAKNATITDSNALVLGTSNLTNNLSITTTGDLTQTGAVTAGGTTTINTNGNDVTLNNPGNDFNTLLLTAKNATITDSNALILGASNLTNNLSITTTGDLTQTGAVTAGGTTTINTNGNDVTLNNAGNDFNSLLLTAKNATITDSNALVLGTSNLTNNLTITTNGDLTQTGAVTAGGTTTINTNGNDVTLNNAGNDFNTLLLTAKNATITDSNALVLGTSNLTNNLSITTNGDLTQTGAVTAGGTTTINTNGNDVTLNNAGNDFNSLLLTAKNATITDSNALVLGASNITTDLTVVTNGDLTQTGAVTAGGTTTINTNGNDVTLNNAGNDFNTLLLTAKNATITDSNALVLGTSNLTNNLTITTTGDLTQTGAVTVGGTTTINTNGNDVTLNNAGNDFNTLLLTAKNATITDSNALVLGTSNLTNNLSITTNGDLTQTGAVTAGGTTTINTNGNDVTLNNPGNDFNTLLLTAKNATITDSNALVLGTSNLTNDLTITTTGDLTQTGAVTAGGTTTINTNGNDVTLNNAGNDFNSLLLTAKNATITDSNALVLGTSNLTNNLTITTTGDLTQTGAVTAGGTTTINTNGDDVTLNNPGNDFNTLLLTAKNATITDSNALVLGTSNLTNNLTITTTGDLTQTGAVTAGGTTTINTNGNDVTLNNAGNDFNSLLLTAKNATITDSNALVLGTSNLTNNLTITTTGDLTQTGAVTVGGTTTINTNGNDVTLNNPGNDFNTLLLTAKNATITDSNALVLGTSNLTNNLTITTTGDLTQTGAVTAGGTTTINTNGNDVTLNNAGNDFNLINLTAKNAKITDTNGLTITGTSITKDLILTANGAVTQTGAILADGLALLGSGNFNLQNPGNSINTLAANTTNDISFVNSKTLTVGIVNHTGITTTGTVFLQTIDGDIILDNSVNSTATGNAITLVADDNFINNAGATALSATNGRWLVYATSPTGNVNGWPVLGGSQQFSTTFPAGALFTGNGFLYKVGAPFVPGVPNLFTTEPVTFTLNFNDRQWRDFAQFSEQSALIESLVCTSDTALADAPVNNSDETLIILDRSINPLALTQRVFFLDNGLPKCETDSQASNF
ncbi:hypothetical protein LQF76_00505 [Gloeomargaritales cyanobacterium VI4D9]|nr:hypothetical protein LQF76_00505 [Gloeomargaritales cyanobacterium VI4D9]